jgi:hypothetical protein
LSDHAQVIPAGNAGIQKPRMAVVRIAAVVRRFPADWIPAIHVGMTGKETFRAVARLCLRRAGRLRDVRFRADH